MSFQGNVQLFIIIILCGISVMLLIIGFELRVYIDTMDYSMDCNNLIQFDFCFTSLF